MKTVGMISRADAALKNFAALTIGFGDPTGTVVSIWMGMPDEDGNPVLKGRKRQVGVSDIEEIVEAIIGREKLSDDVKFALDDVVSEIDMAGAPLKALRIVLPIKAPEWERLEKMFGVDQAPRTPIASKRMRIEASTIRALESEIRRQVEDLTRKMVVGDRVHLNRVRIIVGAGLRIAGGWRVSVSRALVGPHRPDPLDLVQDSRGWQFVAIASWGMPIPVIAGAILDSVDPGHPTVSAYLAANEKLSDTAWLDRYTSHGFGRAMDRHAVHIVDGVVDLRWPADAKPIEIRESKAAIASPHANSELLELIDD